MARAALAVILTLGVAAVAWGQAGIRCRDRDYLGAFETPVPQRHMIVEAGIGYFRWDWDAVGLFDLSDPLHPLMLSVVEIPTELRDLDLVDGRLFAATRNGLAIVDVSDPGAPRLIGSGEASGSVASVAGGNRFAATIGSSRQLELFDLADPSSPVPAGTYWSGSNSGVLVVGDVAITAGDYPNVMIVDTADCPPCAADFNGDGTVDTQDVLAFLNAWAAGDSSADVTGDGVVDTQDVLAFLNAWGAGC